MNFLENVIKAVAPETALRREKARMRLKAMFEARNMYDGASIGRRTAGWRRVSTDANSETAFGTLARLRDSARDLVRNNEFAESGVDGIATYTVGAGIVPHFKGPTDQITETLERLAIAHFDSTDIDAQQQHDLYGLQAQVMRTVAESGECLVRRRRRRLSDGLALPFAIQVLEPDFLDATKDGDAGNGNTVVQGVEFDAKGRRQAYWLFDEHPGSRSSYRLPTSRRIPARDIAHIYRQLRPGQVRGVTWLASTMVRLNDFGDYEDAQLMRQKIAACFAAFVTDIEGVGAGDGGHLTTVGGDTSNYRENLEPGLIETLPPGRDIRFGDPPGVDGYGEYSSRQLHAVAAGLKVPYELLTGDYSNVNYSSARMAWQNFYKKVAVWQKQIMIPQFCRVVERWFLEAAAVSNGTGGYIKAIWTPPPPSMVDPTKEIAAQRDDIRSGTKTLSDAVRERGKDPKEHFAELQADFALLDELGLTLDCDPRRVSRTGTMQREQAVSDMQET
ncbi:MAG: phage portal protein [Pseudomonadota bacterium]|nr:phage portal protein [Pseudomonadota bacterium]